MLIYNAPITEHSYFVYKIIPQPVPNLNNPFQFDNFYCCDKSHMHYNILNERFRKDLLYN